jgi:Flp pilus assembly protein TadG
MRRLLKHRFLRLGRGQEGVAVVEFALILLPLLLLLGGALDFGHFYYLRHVITSASREGARYAAMYTTTTIDPTSSDISNYVKLPDGANYNSLSLDNLIISGSYVGASPNKIVTVTVQADKHWWILGSLPGFTDPKTLTATTAMAVERP